MGDDIKCGGYGSGRHFVGIMGGLLLIFLSGCGPKHKIGECYQVHNPIIENFNPIEKIVAIDKENYTVKFINPFMPSRICTIKTEIGVHDRIMEKVSCPSIMDLVE